MGRDKPLTLVKKGSQRGCGRSATAEAAGSTPCTFTWRSTCVCGVAERQAGVRARGTPDDTGKEDVVALDPSEEVVISRRFRTFTGPYVAHCHNLAHEDHNMMFGWEILPCKGLAGTARVERLIGRGHGYRTQR